MNLFRLFAGSFHSAAAYRYMRAKATGGMGYALFVVALVTLYVLIYFGSIAYATAFASQDGKPALFDQVMQQISDQAPIMTLKGDTLATQKPERTIISIHGQYGTDEFNEPLITIDTTGATTTDKATSPILITDKQLYIRSSNNEWKLKPLGEFTKNGPDIIVINHAVAQEMTTGFNQYIRSHLIDYGLIIWLLCITCLFVVTFFIVITLGLIGIVMGSLINSPLSFGAATALASLSFTPVAILDAGLLTLFGYATHMLTLLVAGTVTLYAAIQCSDPRKPVIA